MIENLIVAGAAALATMTTRAQTPSSDASAPGRPSDARRGDFDYFIGTWAVDARRLRWRASGGEFWEPVTGTTRVTPILLGAGNLDLDEFQLGDQPYVGGMLRLFDAKKGIWSTYGFSRDDGAMQPPLYGGFKGCKGEFFGDDVEREMPIRVRHLYLNRSPDSCRWEQALSRDAGDNWETNWVIEFARATQG